MIGLGKKISKSHPIVEEKVARIRTLKRSRPMVEAHRVFVRKKSLSSTLLL